MITLRTSTSSAAAWWRMTPSKLHMHIPLRAFAPQQCNTLAGEFASCTNIICWVRSYMFKQWNNKDKSPVCLCCPLVLKSSVLYVYYFRAFFDASCFQIRFYYASSVNRDRPSAAKVALERYAYIEVSYFVRRQRISAPSMINPFESSPGPEL